MHITEVRNSLHFPASAFARKVLPALFSMVFMAPADAQLIQRHGQDSGPDRITTDGTGTGIFTGAIAGLTAGTTKDVRAYATNSAGTVYGNEVTFSTTAGGCTFTDSRDGREYKCVKIGDQTWMAENLAWLPEVSPSSAGSESIPYYYVYGYEGNIVSAAKATANFSTYGALYNWEAAKISCPPDWHLPTDGEWTELTDFLGLSAGGQMKETGLAHWISPNTGASNTSGFTALPSGYREEIGVASNLGYFTSLWSSSESSASFAWDRSVGYDRINVVRIDNIKSYGFAVRCLRDPVTPVIPTVTTTKISAITDISASGGGNVTSDGGAPVTARGVCWNTTGTPTTADSITSDGTGTGIFTSVLAGLTAGTTYYARAYATNSAGTGYGNEVTFNTTAGGCTFTDSRDGREYKCVKIGDQTWMAENLAWLPEVSPSSARSSADPNYYVYGYEGSAVSEAKASANFTAYGALYNWNAANNSCPEGWHLPTDDEWKILEMNQGMSQSDADLLGYRSSGSVGAKLKEAGTSHWLSPNSGATNSSGFTVLPGGNFGDPGFNSLNRSAFFWQSTADTINPGFHSYRSMFYTEAGVGRASDIDWRGLSVRCVQGSSPCVPPDTVTVSGAASFCSGGNTTLTATGGSGGTIYYQGTTSGGTSTGDNSISKVITAAGTYYFRARTDLGCWGVEGYLTVTENPLPTATLASSDADNSFCAGTSVTFTAGGGTNYDFRVNSISVQNGTSNIYTTTSLTNRQVVDVVVTNAAGCPATSNTLTMTVNALPATSVIDGNTSPGCNATGITYSVTLTPGSDYAWTVPAGASITSGTTGPNNNQITVSFGTTNGNITVVETSAAGCTGTQRSLAISLAGCGLDANFSATPLTICVGQAVTFTDLSTGTTGNTTYSWDFGAGASPANAVTAGPHVVTYSFSGVKTVSLTVKDGTEMTESKPDYIGVTPSVTVAAFSPDASTRCQGAETITYSTTATDFTEIIYSLDQASLAAGNTIDAATGAVTFDPAWSGTTTITARATGCNGPATTTHVVTITSLAIPVFAPIGPLKQYSTPPPLPAKSLNNITGTWIPPSISTTDFKTTTYAFIPDTGQCATGTSINVVVMNQDCPGVNLGPDIKVCSETPVTLRGDDGSGETYLWSRIENLAAVEIGTADSVLADRTGNYILSVTKNACTITDTVYVRILDPRLSGIDSVRTSDNTCFDGQEGSIGIFIHGTGNSYQYSIDQGDNMQDTSLFENLRTGRYLIRVSEDSLCIFDYPDTVSIRPADSIHIRYQVRSPRCKTCNDGRLTLEITGGWGGYGITLSGIPAELVTESLAAGDYTLVVTDAKGCSKTIGITVEGINIPNVITPNGDGLNDLWKIPVLEYYPDAVVRVFAVNGKLVFESAKGYPVPWDGKTNGNPLPAGTYYYLIDPGPGEEQLTGYLTILK